ncbi:hypothetical protein CkaCkLH20_07432 [Colletotrichum karsti]|uniref:Uncharacterized protein n=1 Tax=Colletotrichum karsti TaxID=1095194 RepID=A0A9P6I715_9PEZI|nr:uncharacterized protein CkaCkLH20_07432 [Colletotrichum karsti]KAF9875166.1 hypothetical protein CkaCkLH20_07432 [Colletotrichum karsti]
MSIEFAKQVEQVAAASSTPTAAPSSRGSSPMSMGGPATTAIAIVVAVLLLVGISLIAFHEHRKKKKADAARRNAGDVEGWDNRQSVASFDTIDEIKAPQPAARNMLQGRRFLFLSRNR